MHQHLVAPVEVARLEEVPEGGGLAVFVGDRAIALWRTGDTVYATDDVCSHMQAILSEGHADGYTITCPRHGGQFDMRTGAAIKMPAFAPIAVFPVEVRDGRIYLEGASL